MLQYYFKTALRAFTKNKAYAGLNIFGLALGFAASIFILQFVLFEKSYETFHRHHENLYRVQYRSFGGDQLPTNSALAAPRIGPFMKENMPEVENFARAYPLFGIVDANGQKFREDQVYMADASFLQMFDFPLIRGNQKEALLHPNEVVITETMAIKYFGSVDVIGEVIDFKSWYNSKAAIVGVIKEVPENSHFTFDFLFSYASLNAQNTERNGYIASEHAWDWTGFYTYVLLKEGSISEAFDRKFGAILNERRGEFFEQNNLFEEYPLQPITDIHLYSKLEREANPAGQGDGQVVWFLSIIAIFILIIAWINYINLSTARAIDRAKEVGIRKTLGALRLHLVHQFLIEAFLFNLIAIALGLLLVLSGIQLFNHIADSHVSTHFFSNPNFWLVLSSVFLIGAVFSGIYPSLVLSSFMPSSIMKRGLSKGQLGSKLRQFLVVFQFASSITLIAGSIIVYQQMNHLKNTELGFDTDDLLTFKGAMIFNEESYPIHLSSFKNELLKIGGIQSVTASSNIPGDEIIWLNSIKRRGQSDKQLKNIAYVGVDDDYFPTLGIDVISGRNFNRTFTSDTGTVALNQAAVGLLGFENAEAAIGEIVMLYGDPKTIIGVVSDYKQMSAKSVVPPIVFPYSPDMTRYLLVKIAPTDRMDLMTSIKVSYDHYFAGNPFEYFLFDEFFDQLYQSDDKFQSIFTLFTVLAIVIACLGLFGLSSYHALQRTKEIGIRKVLGASMQNILVLLTKDYLLLIVVANVLSWPLIYFSMNRWLNHFAERIPFEFITFIAAGLIAALVALLTIGVKSVQTAKANPAEALKYE